MTTSVAGLTNIVNNALSGLNVNQDALAVLSQNIANANTPNYSRQLVNEQAMSLNGQGVGVSIASITRKVDQYLVAASQQQNSTVGMTGVTDDYNSRIQLLLGAPGSQNNINSYINNFFTSLQALSTTPQDSNLQQAAVSNGVTLASQVHQLAQGLQNLQFQADQDIQANIGTVNNDLKSVFQLNTAIANGIALGQSVADLQDQRDAAVSDIAKYINVQAFNNSDGSINLTTSNGVSLLDHSLYALSYSGVGSASAFSNGSTLSPLTVAPVDSDGNPTGPSTQLVSGGVVSSVTSTLTSGALQGLIAMRDQQIPDMLAQLDQLAGTIRDQINTVSNEGSGYPGANSYTGTRLLTPQQSSQWSGSVQIAALNSSGNPVASPYADEPYGMQPLTLDLGTLDTGGGAGNPSVQGIINAINQYYGVPQNKAEVGNLNNIQLASDSASLPGQPPQLAFDFNLNNISASSANFFVTGVSVQDNGGSPMTPVTSTIPSIALNATNTYVTTASSGTVTVNTTGANNLTNGETVYLSTPPGGPYNGIPAADLGGFFTISNVTASSFQITAAGGAVANPGVQAPIAISGMTAMPPYSTVDAGGQQRTSGSGIITASLTNNTLAAYYTVTVNVAVEDGSGTISQAQIAYQVSNQQSGMLNDLIGAQSVSGSGSLVKPTSTQPIATAQLVDASGNPLPMIGGQYVSSDQGYLQIKATNSNNIIAINSLDSIEQGQPNNSPPLAGTNWGFSHYFDLNDFFQSNSPTSTGDTTANSALGMQVASRFQSNSGLFPTGTLTQSPPSSDPSALPNYTYERDIGDSSIVQKMMALGLNSVSFSATGGLGATTQTLSGYAGEIIGAASTIASNASTASTNAQTLFNGYTQQASSISGVNLDTELANTVIYQNAYAASARVISVTTNLFNTLLQTFS